MSWTFTTLSTFTPNSSSLSLNLTFPTLGPENEKTDTGTARLSAITFKPVSTISYALNIANAPPKLCPVSVMLSSSLGNPDSTLTVGSGQGILSDETGLKKSIRSAIHSSRVTVPLHEMVMSRRPRRSVSSSFDTDMYPIQFAFLLQTLGHLDFLKKFGRFITMATSETNSESGPINPNVQHGDGTNYILNGLDNALYNVYSPMVNAKALWESLERKYKTEDAGSKKFVVGKFLDFKMMDSKTVISQVQEFQLILHDIHAEGMVLGESFQVAALIEKLPPTWKDFKNYLKHKRKEMKLEDLIVRLRIEEDNRQSEKKAGNYHQEAKANVVEQDVLSLYPGRLSSRTVSTIAGRISLKDSESNSRLDLFPLLFCNLLVSC
ncbi:hypothetical protein RJ639_025018 [Escallonia herrerae]|uniref:Uncharacterized protein n=2 Tax=Escallonia herrerae TaxID=1293975 RepID=A0AA88S600_9ASTE|nr:hypothetical protein RJ639_025018 [Escallonia herrerae]